MLYEGLSLIKGFVKFFGFFALFFLALSGGFCLLSGMIYMTNGDSPQDTAAAITAINDLPFAVFILVALFTGKVETIVSACWHALGVGCIMYGVLLAVELAVIGIIGLCCYCADARKKKEQDGVKLGPLAAAV